jgi:hypothetical protein
MMTKELYIRMVGWFILLMSGICYTIVTLMFDPWQWMLDGEITQVVMLWLYNIFSTLVAIVSFILILHKDNGGETPREPEQAQEPSIKVHVIDGQRNI